MGCKFPIMGTHAVQQGPTAKRVAKNIAELRAARGGLSLRELAERMGEIGRPIQASGLSKIEQGDRRVDVDDLMALAIALDVSPNRLLLPGTATEDKIELVPEGTTTTDTAWRWATGEAPLPLDVWGPKVDINLDRKRRFGEENRPHDPRDSMPASELVQHEDVLVPVVEAIAAARGRGLSLKTIVGYVKLMDAMKPLARWARQQLSESERDD